VVVKPRTAADGMIRTAGAGLVTELEREFRPELQPLVKRCGAFSGSLYSDGVHFGLTIRDGYHFGKLRSTI